MPKNTNKKYNNHALKRNSSINTAKPKLFIYPKWKMYHVFPWQVWAVGWLAIFKGVLWLATDPNIPSPLREIIGTKYLLFMLPLIISGIGIWNLRKWGIWGIVFLSVMNLLFFLLYPHLVSTSVSYSQLIRFVVGSHFIILQFILFLCNGPLGDVLILVASPIVLKHTGKIYTFTKQPS